MKCHQCGAIVSEGFIFCDKCGTRLDSHAVPSNSQPPQEQRFEFIIQRVDQFFIGPSAKIKIFLDHNEGFSLIENGESQKFLLPAGDHNVVLSCWFRTTDFDINIQRNTSIAIKFNRSSGKIDVDFRGNSHFIRKHK